MTQANATKEQLLLKKAFKEIHFYRGVAPTQAYEILIQNPSSSTPRLLEIIQQTIQRHDHTGDYYVAHIHALLLLAELREKKAYPLVINLLNLPFDSIDKLLGDMLTESIPKIILSIYDGNPEALYSLLFNSKTDPTLRSVIGATFSALVQQNLIAKEELLIRLQEVIASGKMHEDRAFFTTLANLAVECKLDPLYDTVRAAIKLGMVYDEDMDLKQFEKDLLQPLDKLVNEEDLQPLKSASKEILKWYTAEKPLTPKIERNGPCPCGSHLKFKKCCFEYL